MPSYRSVTVEDRQQLLNEAVLDALTVAVLVVGGDRRVIYSNRTATRLLASADGLALVNHNLTVALGTERDGLKRLLDQGSGLMRISRPSGQCPYMLHVSPLHRSGAALVVLNDPETQSAEPEAFLASLYGLTPAQARLARGLLDGETLETLSKRDSVSRNTLRAHLVQLFAKTDTHRQAELMRRLMRDLQVVSLTRPPISLAPAIVAHRVNQLTR